LELAWWVVVVVMFPIYAAVGGALYILWTWRDIPAILRETVTPTPPERQEDTTPGLPAGAEWYRAPETTQDPTQKSVYWPEEPGNT
jgi:hypothetical protein